MSIAEYFRDQGKNVLLVMDSLTRFAQSQREIALSIGEPPATKGYPPSVFSLLPQLVERAGNINGSGSITGIFTVLAEADDENDPIVDAARAILDGHIFLNRELADQGHFPAIDITKSISRLQQHVVAKDDLRYSKLLKQLYSTYEEKKDLINIGAYNKGNDKQLDIAVGYIEKINKFLVQESDEQFSYEQCFDIIKNMFEDHERK